MSFVVGILADPLSICGAHLPLRLLVEREEAQSRVLQAELSSDRSALTLTAEVVLCISVSSQLASRLWARRIGCDANTAIGGRPELIFSHLAADSDSSSSSLISVSSQPVTSAGTYPGTLLVRGSTSATIYGARDRESRSG